MTRRSSLYWSVLAFVTAIAKHTSFVNILTEKRPEKERSPGLQALGEEANWKGFIFNSSESGLAASLVTGGYVTDKQAKTFTRLAKNSAMAEKFQSSENSEYLSL